MVLSIRREVFKCLGIVPIALIQCLFIQLIFPSSSHAVSVSASPSATVVGGTITASWSGFGGTVNVEVWKGGSFDQYASTTSPGTGSQALGTATWELRDDYRVKVVLKTNTSIYGFSAYFSVNNPAVSVSPASTNVGGTITASWSGFGGTVNVEVWKGGSFIQYASTTSPGTGSQALVTTGWDPASNYRVKVVLKSNTSVNRFSSYFSVIDPPLSPPSLISPIGGTTVTSVQLRWSQVGSASGYQLGVDGNTVNISSGTQTTYSPSLGYGAHQWRARTKNSTGIYGSWSGYASFTYEPVTPPPPVITGPANYSVFKNVSPAIRFDWNAVSPVTSYQLYVSTNAGLGNPKEIDRSLAVSPSYYDLATALSNNVWYWSVEAINAGQYSGTSGNIRTFILDTPLGAPNITYPTGSPSFTEGDSDTFTWSVPSGGTTNRYNIRLVSGSGINVGSSLVGDPSNGVEQTGASYFVNFPDAGTFTFGVRAMKQMPAVSDYIQSTYETAIGWGPYDTLTFTVTPTTPVNPVISFVPDKSTYYAGESVSQNGSGFTPNGTCTVEVTRDGSPYSTFSLGADGTGAWVNPYTFPAESAGSMTFTATDDTSGIVSNTKSYTIAVANPTIAFVPDKSTYDVGESISQNGSGFTPNGTCTVVVTLGGSPYATFTLTADGAGAWANPYTFPAESVGSLTFTATDNTSGIVSNTKSYTVVTPPPTLGSLRVFDYHNSCDINDRDELVPTDEKYLEIKVIRDEIETYVQDNFGRFGWNGAGGGVEIFLDVCASSPPPMFPSGTGSIRDVSLSLAFIALEINIFPLPYYGNDETLDVIAHEYYHGVMEKEGIPYSGDPNKSVIESLCDIFAVTIDDEGGTDWIIGEGSTLRPFRDFQDFFHMNVNWDTNVYTNAQIHNHAAYLWTRDYLGGDRDRMAEVFYFALDYLPPECNFAMLRLAAVAAAANLGYSAAEIQGLESSYDTVGIGARMDSVWVDYTQVGPEIGSEELPFKIIASGVGHLNPGGTLMLKPVTWPDTPTLSTPMRLEAIGGTARIGDSAARNAGALAEEGFISRTRE